MSSSAFSNIVPPRGPIRTVAIRVMCYDERATIVEVVRRALEAGRAARAEVSVEVIDDGSTDGSGDLVIEAFARDDAVSVFRHPRRLGIGAVLRRAFRSTDADAVVLLCGDLQFAPEDVFALVEELKDADLAIARRRDRKDSLMRRAITELDRKLTQWALGNSYPDVHWVRAVRGPWLARCRFVTHSPVVDLELAHTIDRLGGRVTTLPLAHYPRQFGRSRGASLRYIGRSVVDLSRYALSLRFRRRD